MNCVPLTFAGAVSRGVALSRTPKVTALRMKGFLLGAPYRSHGRGCVSGASGSLNGTGANPTIEASWQIYASLPRDGTHAYPFSHRI